MQKQNKLGSPESEQIAKVLEVQLKEGACLRSFWRGFEPNFA